MRRKPKEIFQPKESQGLLFDSHIGHNYKETQGAFPAIVKDLKYCILNNQDPYQGFDLEYDPKTLKPGILGWANNSVCGAVPWDEQLMGLILERAERGQKLVAFNTVSADKCVVDKWFKVTPLDWWEDGQLTHYLANQDLCKTPAKEEDETDPGSLGLMNLWTAASLVTDLPQWKRCRGKICYGPCPQHKPFEYCAVDAWAGLSCFTENKVDMKLYRETLELSEICYKMQTNGIKVDVPFVKELEKDFDRRKFDLFPYEMHGKTRVFTEFNPGSSQQVMEYFSHKGIQLKSANKKEIKKTLDKLLKQLGFDPDNLTEEDTLPPEVDMLHKTWQFKESGKGLTSWFNERYLDDNGYIHPRFIITGTSTGRLSSSGPNFQNIPRVGFGARVRKALVAEKGKLFLKMDFSQLELRKVLHSSGSTRKMTGDAFKDLVEASEGKFDEAAKLYHLTVRDIAKSVSHAGNYGEGFQLLNGSDLSKDRIKKEVDAGARLIFRDWDYCGDVVSFTGTNLAERLFRNKTIESRAKALKIQEIYFQTFPEIRQWQHKMTTQAEDEVVHYSTGRVLRLNEGPEENFKMALAAVGQGEGADHVQAIMLRFYKELGIIPKAQVHDELIFEIEEKDILTKGKEYHKIMEEPTWRFPDFRCPAKAKYGQSWLEKEMLSI